MNKDQVPGKVEQAIGNVMQSVGEVWNEKLANQGVADQAKGATKETSTLAKKSMYDVLVASVRVTGWARTGIGQQQGRGMCDEGFRTWSLCQRIRSRSEKRFFGEPPQESSQVRTEA